VLPKSFLLYQKETSIPLFHIFISGVSKYLGMKWAGILHRNLVLILVILMFLMVLLVPFDYKHRDTIVFRF
jgi:hypothetical protein